MSVTLRASDPRVFGPPVWRALHVLAAGYPKRPSPKTRKSCRLFLRHLAVLLPCSSCGSHFSGFIEGADLGAASQSRRALVQLLVEAHNEVSKHTHPTRAPFTLEDAKVYAQGLVALPLAPLWAHDEPPGL
jgi:hypothetical protein